MEERKAVAARHACADIRDPPPPLVTNGNTGKNTGKGAGSPFPLCAAFASSLRDYSRSHPNKSSLSLSLCVFSSFVWCGLSHIALVSRSLSPSLLSLYPRLALLLLLLSLRFSLFSTWFAALSKSSISSHSNPTRPESPTTEGSLHQPPKFIQPSSLGSYRSFVYTLFPILSFLPLAPGAANNVSEVVIDSLTGPIPAILVTPTTPEASV